MEHTEHQKNIPERQPGTHHVQSKASALATIILLHRCLVKVLLGSHIDQDCVHFWVSFSLRKKYLIFKGAVLVWREPGGQGLLDNVSLPTRYRPPGTRERELRGRFRKSSRQQSVSVSEVCNFGVPTD